MTPGHEGTEHITNKENAMKRFAIPTLVALVLAGSVFGQEPNEYLKGYAPFIGQWEHQGTVLEKGPFAEQAKVGSRLFVRISWTWILDKQALMWDWSIEFQGGPKISGKELIGWNAADRKIVGGGMNSMGGMGIGTRVIDGETITSTNEGADGEGAKSSYTEVIKKTDTDTLTWQAVERTGGDVEGPSPVYTFKRVK
jgi:hypothetical protein